MVIKRMDVTATFSSPPDIIGTWSVYEVNVGYGWFSVPVTCNPPPPGPFSCDPAGSFLQFRTVTFSANNTFVIAEQYTDYPAPVSSDPFTYTYSNGYLYVGAWSASLFWNNGQWEMLFESLNGISERLKKQ